MTDGKESKSGLIYKKGAIVKFRVNAEKRTIAFAVNQSAFKILANIDASDDPYFLAVGLYWNDNRLSLVSYSGPQRDAEESKEPENNVCSFHF